MLPHRGGERALNIILKPRCASWRDADVVFVQSKQKLWINTCDFQLDSVIKRVDEPEELCSASVSFELFYFIFF